MVEIDTWDIYPRNTWNTPNRWGKTNMEDFVEHYIFAMTKLQRFLVVTLIKKTYSLKCYGSELGFEHSCNFVLELLWHASAYIKPAVWPPYEQRVWHREQSGGRYCQHDTLWDARTSTPTRKLLCRSFYISHCQFLMPVDHVSDYYYPANKVW